MLQVDVARRKLSEIPSHIIMRQECDGQTDSMCQSLTVRVRFCNPISNPNPNPSVV